jgi:hypothetical protein
MALLHSHASQYEAALRMLLQLPPGQVCISPASPRHLPCIFPLHLSPASSPPPSPLQANVFDFVEEHSLQTFCRDKVLALVAHGWDRSLAMLLRHPEAFPPVEVVAQLEGLPELRLHEYLDALYQQDSKTLNNLGVSFHTRQLRLYGRHAPDKLLPFMRVSSHYPLDTALEICREVGHAQGEVFVLFRMGSHEEALALMLGKLGDMQVSTTCSHRM